MSDKHTPTPWSIGGDGADIFGFGIEPDDCRHVADVQPNDSGLLGMETIDIANAAFIVLAVNNHNKLVSLLETVTNMVGIDIDRLGKDCGEPRKYFIEQAQALLKEIQ